VRAAAVAIAVAATLIQIPGIVSNQRIRASDAALAAGDLAGARELAEQAADAQPWAAAPQGQLATVDREAGELESAESEIGVAIEREPTNWQWPLILAPIQAEAGRRDDAVRTFADGRRLAPDLYYYSPFSIGYGQEIFTPAELERKHARRQAEAAGAPE
jgi:hypothetical protein